MTRQLACARHLPFGQEENTCPRARTTIMDDNGYTDKWFTRATRFNRLVLCCALIVLILAVWYCLLS